MNMKRIGLIISVYFATVITVNAQNNTSPYSVAGIGDIENGYFDRATGMANSGLSLSSSRFLFQANPATYSSLDDHFFHAELSARFEADYYQGSFVNTASNTSTDLQIKKLAFAIKVKKRWGISFGLLPFSNSNYSFYAPKSILGSSYVSQAYYVGSGGLNQVYFANSYQLTKELSIGLHSAFIFGHLQQTETVGAGIIDSALTTTSNTYYTNPYFKLGVQYHKKLSSKLQMGLGATGSLQTKLRTVQSVTLLDGNSQAYTNGNYSNDYYRLPYTYGAGVSAIIKDRYTISTDYNFQSWSNQLYSGVGYSLTNSQRYSAGFEYSKKLHYRNLTFEKYFLQAGVYYSNSYLIINSNQINDMGGSLGAGFNFTNGLGMQLGLQAGSRGTIANGLIKENYAQFTLTFSYRDLWLSHIKRYD
jgi:hypothetical protein